MTAYVALLRAVNVGGTGKLPMEDLKRLCERAGFGSVRTYIASGNVVFKSGKTESAVKKALETELAAYADKSVGVLVRTAEEMAKVAADSPFPDAKPSYCVAIFLDEKPPKGVLDNLKGRQDEEVALGLREIYVHYPSGQGKSKLSIPAAKAGTARNMNTIAKLAEMGTPSPKPGKKRPSGKNKNSL